MKGFSDLGSGYLLKAFLPFFLAGLLPFGPKLGSGCYEWSKLKIIRSHTGSYTNILKGPTRSLEMFQIKAVTLYSQKETHNYLVDKGSDELIIIKEGTALISINNEKKEMGAGSIAVASRGDRVLIKNSQTDPLTFYSINFKPRTSPAERQQEGKMIPHFFKEWKTLEFVASANGGRRNVMQQQTSVLKELEIHVTTLNEGLASHSGHNHPDEEIILVRYGTVEETINGVTGKAGPGSVIFVTNNDNHGVKNAGTGPCEYYAIRWLVYNSETVNK